VAVPDWLVYDFYAPFVLTELRGEDNRWLKIDEYFGVARRLAYLNRDTTLIDSPITVALSPLISTISDAGELTQERLAQSREIIAAFEHTVYERFYHALAARKATAVVSSHLFELLNSRGDYWHDVIEAWLFGHALEDVLDVPVVSSLVRSAEAIGSLSLRSFFLFLHSEYASAEEALSGTIRAVSAPNNSIAVGTNVYKPLTQNTRSNPTIPILTPFQSAQHLHSKRVDS